MLDRLPRLLDADEFEAALSACVAQGALDPAIPVAYAVMRPPPTVLYHSHARRASQVTIA